MHTPHVQGFKEMAQQRHLKNFKALKKRIIMTDELILKYQHSQQKLKETQDQLLSLQHCVDGLKEEVETLHQKNEALKEDYRKCLEENDFLKESRESEELLNKQLTAQNRQLSIQLHAIKKDSSAQSKITTMAQLTLERDKWVERCKKMVKAYGGHMTNTAKNPWEIPTSVNHGTDSNFLPPDLPSPPYSCSTVSSDPKSCAAMDDMEFPTMEDSTENPVFPLMEESPKSELEANREDFALMSDGELPAKEDSSTKNAVFPSMEECHESELEVNREDLASMSDGELPAKKDSSTKSEVFPSMEEFPESEVGREDFDSMADGNRRELPASKDLSTKNEVFPLMEESEVGREDFTSMAESGSDANEDGSSLEGSLVGSADGRKEDFSKGEVCPLMEDSPVCAVGKDTAERGEKEVAERGGEDIAERVGEEIAERGGKEMAAREGQEMAKREGEEMAEREGKEMAAREGQEMAEREGKEMAERGGKEMAERGGKEMAAREGQEMAAREGQEMAERGGKKMAEREGQEMAERGGKEMAAREGQEMAKREGQEMAKREGQEMAEREGKEMAERGGKEDSAKSADSPMGREDLAPMVESVDREELPAKDVSSTKNPWMDESSELNAVRLEDFTSMADSSDLKTECGEVLPDTEEIRDSSQSVEDVQAESDGFVGSSEVTESKAAAHGKYNNEVLPSMSVLSRTTSSSASFAGSSEVPRKPSELCSANTTAGRSQTSLSKPEKLSSASTVCSSEVSSKPPAPEDFSLATTTGSSEASISKPEKFTSACTAKNSEVIPTKPAAPDEPSSTASVKTGFMELFGDDLSDDISISDSSSCSSDFESGTGDLMMNEKLSRNASNQYLTQKDEIEREQVCLLSSTQLLPTSSLPASPCHSPRPPMHRSPSTSSSPVPPSSSPPTSPLTSISSPLSPYTSQSLSPLPPSPVTRSDVLSPIPSSPRVDLSPLPRSPTSIERPLSPLPQSPVNDRQWVVRSVSVISPIPDSPFTRRSDLSPFPQSPVQSISPLPQSPITDHQHLLRVISPLPDSPFDPQSRRSPPQNLSSLPSSPASNERYIISPLPPSPTNGHLLRVISPLPDSPFNAYSKGLNISPLPHSPAAVEQRIISPLPQSPTNGYQNLVRATSVISPLPDSPFDPQSIRPPLPTLSPLPLSPTAIERPISPQSSASNARRVILPLHHSPLPCSPLPRSPLPRSSLPCSSLEVAQTLPQSPSEHGSLPPPMVQPQPTPHIKTEFPVFADQRIPPQPLPPHMSQPPGSAHAQSMMLPPHYFPPLPPPPPPHLPSAFIPCMPQSQNHGFMRPTCVTHQSTFVQPTSAISFPPDSHHSFVQPTLNAQHEPTSFSGSLLNNRQHGIFPPSYKPPTHNHLPSADNNIILPPATILGKHPNKGAESGRSKVSSKPSKCSKASAKGPVSKKKKRTQQKAQRRAAGMTPRYCSLDHPDMVSRMDVSFDTLLQHAKTKEPPCCLPGGPAVAGPSNVGRIGRPSSASVVGGLNVGVVEEPNVGVVGGPSNVGVVGGPSNIGVVGGPSNVGVVEGPNVGVVGGPSNVSVVEGPNVGVVGGPSNVGVVESPNVGVVGGPSNVGVVERPNVSVTRGPSNGWQSHVTRGPSNEGQRSGSIPDGLSQGTNPPHTCEKASLKGHEAKPSIHSHMTTLSNHMTSNLISSTPLPSALPYLRPPCTLSHSTSSSSTTTTTSTVTLPILQQQLNKAMQCPLPLPHWLVAAMTETQSVYQHCAASGMHLNKKKRGNMKSAIFRQSAQKTANYVVTNLERLACGHLYLEPIIAMFTHKFSVPNSGDVVEAVIKFFLQCYNPKIEHVFSMFHKQSDTLRSKNPFLIEPGDPNFPPALLRPECQLVALLAHMCRMSKPMTNLLDEICKALYEAMLKPNLRIHKLMAMARVFTALLRLQADPNRIVFFLGDLLKKPLLPVELHAVSCVAGVWPLPLRRKSGVALFKADKLSVDGVEEQMISYTLEVLVMTKYKDHGSKEGVQESFARHLQLLCGWTRNPNSKLLSSHLMHIMKTSSKVFIDSSPSSCGVWQRPRPTITAYNIVHCLHLLCRCNGWPWTNDFLIAKHLWPILQEWNESRSGATLRTACCGSDVKDSVVVCVLRLIGFICRVGPHDDPAPSSIGQLQRVLVAVLKESCTKSIILPIQLAALDSLMEMCPVSNPSSDTASVVGVIGEWLKVQMQHPWGHVLDEQLKQKLQSGTINQ